MRIAWEVERTANGWAGHIDLPIGPGEAMRIRRVASSPGEAIEGAIMGAEEVCGALEEVGFDLGSIIPGILNTAGDVVRMVSGRTRRGEPPVTPATAALPGEYARLAYTAAMRPGGLTMPGPGGAPIYGMPFPGFPGGGMPGAGKPWTPGGWA